VKDTLNRIIPEEVNYLNAYDAFKQYIDSQFDMPDSLIGLLVQFLEKGNGQLSKRARLNEFKELNEEEVRKIEEEFAKNFLNKLS
ncbi:MAG: cell filamentation protein Fic, partial [Flavobacteriia bacterium]